MRKILKNKPLVEAIFELRWELENRAPSGIGVDPHYELLVGALHEKGKSEYSFHEKLPVSEIPNIFTPYIIHHRFRRGNGQWPLVQIGPGIIALNDTTGYVWEDFRKRISWLVSTLFDIYPDKENLKFNMAMLRYIDSKKIEYQDNFIQFLQENMGVVIDIRRDLFTETGIAKPPFNVALELSYYSTKPKGAMDLKIRSRERDGTKDLVWETIFRSRGDDTPTSVKAVNDWSEEAHVLTVDWFFKLIEGNLLEEFK